MNISKLMKEAMINKQMSLYSFAEACELGYSRAWNIKKGLVEPTEDDIEKMSKVYPAFKNHISTEQTTVETAIVENETVETAEKAVAEKTKRGSSFSEFGKNLNLLLKQRKMTIKELSKATGLPTYIINNMRRGSTKPSSDRVTAIAFVLNVNVEKLVPEFKVEEPKVLPWSGKEISKPKEETNEKVSLVKNKDITTKLHHTMLNTSGTCIVFTFDDGSVMMTEVSGRVVNIEYSGVDYVNKATGRISSGEFMEARRFDIILFMTETLKSFNIVIDNILKEQIIKYAMRL